MGWRSAEAAPELSRGEIKPDGVALLADEVKRCCAKYPSASIRFSSISSICFEFSLFCSLQTDESLRATL